MNNEMDDFSSKPGSPNMFGLIGGKANSIKPKKRMLSSMTPTIVEKKWKIIFNTWDSGGSTIITSVFKLSLMLMNTKWDIPRVNRFPKISSSMGTRLYKI